MPKDTLRIATRSSLLALQQANTVRDQLALHWPNLTIELVPLVTSGDKASSFLQPKTTSTKGLFVKELEEALLDGRADLAVHSMKDVPSEFPEGLALHTMMKRHNPMDALVSGLASSLSALPMGAKLGTSSLRRQSQLLAYRSDFQVIPLRGNIHTRLSKLDSGTYDGIILAAAGLERMEFHHRITETISPSVMLPACGQGALGIEGRTNDDELSHYLTPLHDANTTLCVNAERHLSALLGGGCHTPLAVYCVINANDSLTLSAKIATPDGQQVIASQQEGLQTHSLRLAELCAEEILSQGGRTLMASLL